MFKNRNVLLIGFLFLALVIVGLSAFGNNNKTEGYLVDDNRYVLFEAKENALISDGVYVADAYIISDGDFFDLVTLVLNDSGVDLDNIHIEFELYDAKGNIIDIKEDNTGKIANGDSFRSSIPITLRRDVYSVKISKVIAR